MDRRRSATPIVPAGGDGLIAGVAGLLFTCPPVRPSPPRRQTEALVANGRVVPRSRSSPRISAGLPSIARSVELGAAFVREVETTPDHRCLPGPGFAGELQLPRVGDGAAGVAIKAEAVNRLSCWLRRLCRQDSRAPRHRLDPA